MTDFGNQYMVFREEKKTHTKVRPPSFKSIQEGNEPRLAVIRYFLDRPGYGLHNSVARIWFDPPEICSPAHVSLFLKQQDIALPGLLVEVYLDKFQSFMLIEGCEASGIEWDFSDSSPQNPGILNIRLTDLQSPHWQEDLSLSFKPSMIASTAGSTATSQSSKALGDSMPTTSHCHEKKGGPEHANSVPLGLFSFSLMVGLETTALMGTLFPGSVEPSFRLAWGPYMFFVGGLLQVIVGTLQVFRNNLYGAVAFLGFGTFWFSNGAESILETYFASEGSMAESLLEGPVDSIGSFIRVLFVFLFTCALWKQTFVMSKLSTTLISLLCAKLIVHAFRLLRDDQDGALAYMQLIIGWLTSAFAFWMFLVEFTNGVYKNQVYPTYKWSEEHSPEEVFGASGNVGTLQSKAARLRQAKFLNYHRKVHTSLPRGQKFGGCDVSENKGDNGELETIKDTSKTS
ncbi:uncharacterized protein FisN_7Lh234 [Fistulifera solaris]|uniref:Uncharacterized protein n=1 Tax=Fistulifera solaris TaxID=1519565 RepID=A0A1Z5JR62_FISSO|nr:uncharacterized protein FisN_7Lh234 [Fistulifera solaris]|eukprot:GAX16513.1 uncharacterized protein FisN_7Lh234 [Fistulifera solaris]